jgi:hypothetical protein
VTSDVFSGSKGFRPFDPGTAAKSAAGQVAERVGGEDWIQGRDVGKLWQRFSGWWFNRAINGHLMVINFNGD